MPRAPRHSFCDPAARLRSAGGGGRDASFVGSPACRPSRPWLAAALWLDDTAASQGEVEAPAFEVDPFWPKPLPNHWVMGSAVGVAVDSRDHVFIIHRQQSLNPATEISAGTDPPSAPDCCVAAPPVLEFDPDGNLVGHWGGPGEGYEWPESNHGITVDPKDNVWIGGNGASDSHILKFTRAGESS